MTPPTTAAARSVARATPAQRRAPVRHPRRVSGPLAGAQALAATAIPAPGVALPRRRPLRPVPAPRRRPARERSRGSGRGTPGIALRAIDVLERVSSSAVLDRLIRGRAWIGLLAFALIGIVAMQLLVLELNTGIGRTLTRVAQLQRENAQLGIEDSTSSAESRIAPLAAAAGMTLASVGAVHFVAASPGDVARAAKALAVPIQPQASVPAESREAEAQESASSGSTGTSESSASTAAQGSGPESSASAAAQGTSPATASTSEASTGEAPAEPGSSEAAAHAAEASGPTGSGG
jgi:hypothetical protein